MPAVRKNSSMGPAVLLAWLVAGTLDLADAIFFSLANGISPERVLRYIASGVLGAGSHKAGLAVPLLGMAMHYGIALAWTVLYIALARLVPSLRRHAVLAGVLYGLVVFFFMNYVAVPLSRIGHVPHYKPIALANAVLALVCCIGLPIALIDRRLSR
jgi:hypothetical protein